MSEEILEQEAESLAEYLFETLPFVPQDSEELMVLAQSEFLTFGRDRHRVAERVVALIARMAQRS